MFKRLINPSKNRSFFIFGARGTGKTTWLKDYFDQDKVLWFDFLDPAEEERFSLHPKEFSSRIEARDSNIEWVVIDEVQKIPSILNLVHHFIEKDKLRFALTGSSARKLKRGGANLLAGRAFVNHLYPLTYKEIGGVSDISSLLHWGSLPTLFDLHEERDKAEYLRSYAQTYLTEEIIAEQLVRKLNPFRRFLQVASQSNGKIINSSRIGRDVGVDYNTVENYFTILEDTYVGFKLYPFISSFRKRLSKRPKFYFFDLGVTRALSKMLEVSLRPETSAFGEAFEHFVILEIYRLCSYYYPDYSLSYIQTKDGTEVDLVIERPGQATVLIEIKSSTQVREDHLRTIRTVHADIENSEAYCFSLDPHHKRYGEVDCYKWNEGIYKIFNLHQVQL